MGLIRTARGLVCAAQDWTGPGYGSGTGNGLPVDWIVRTGRDWTGVEWTGLDSNGLGLGVVDWIVWTALDWTGTGYGSGTGTGLLVDWIVWT